MSTRIMSAFWPITMPPAKKAVAISLADQANDEGICWPGLGTISKRTCLNEKSVRRAVQWLEQAGYIRAEMRPGQSTVYRLNPHPQAVEKRPLTPPTESGPPLPQSPDLPPGPLPQSPDHPGLSDPPPLDSVSRTPPTESCHPSHRVHLTVKNRKEPYSLKTKLGVDPSPQPPPPTNGHDHRDPEPLELLPPAPPPAPPLLTIPTNKPGVDFPVDQALAAELAAAYPAVDVPAELLKIRVWAVTNVRLRKTLDGMPRAINSWISKAQNQATSGNSSHQHNGAARFPTAREREAEKQAVAQEKRDREKAEFDAWHRRTYPEEYTQETSHAEK